MCTLMCWNITISLKQKQEIKKYNANIGNDQYGNEWLSLRLCEWGKRCVSCSFRRVSSFVTLAQVLQLSAIQTMIRMSNLQFVDIWFQMLEMLIGFRMNLKNSSFYRYLRYPTSFIFQLSVVEMKILGKFGMFNTFALKKYKYR